MEFEYLFIFDTLTTLVAGYSFSVLAEKVPEPGATITLLIFLVFLFLLIEGSRELGDVISQRKTLIQSAPSLAVKWIIGAFLPLFPVFYALGLNLPDIYFYMTRTVIAVLAWVLPVPYVMMIIKQEVIYRTRRINNE